LFLGKSTKTSATRAALLTPTCTKSFVGWGFASDPTEGVYSAPQQTRQLYLGGLLLNGGQGRVKERKWTGGEGMVMREFVDWPRKKKENSAPMFTDIYL